MESSFRLFRVRGIEIGANWSWLIVFALVAWSLGAALFPRTYPGLDTTTYYVMGVVAAVLFFGSILLHELGHAFRALKEGVEIDGITLWLFGGVARFKSMFPSAGAEFRIAIAGPIVSVLIGGFFFLLTWVGNALGWPDQAVGVVDYLFRINLIVVAFNLVPALPLDGGRVLRAWLWHRQRNFRQATVSAARAGRAFGGVLIGIGILGFITGAGIGGLWFVFLGWFLLQAAGSEASYALIRTALRGQRVRDLMSRDPATVDPDLSLADFVDQVSRTRGHSTYPVVEGGSLAGLVSIRHAARVEPQERGTVSVRDVMLPRSEVPVLDPDTEVMDALQRLQSGPGRAVVMDDGHVSGILSVSDVARALEFAQLRGPEDEEPVDRRSTWPVWVVVALVIIAAAGFLYHPPVAVISPGESFDITDEISISGTSVDPVEGEYLLTSVRLEQPNGIDALWALIQGDEILSLNAVIPRGVDPEDYLEQQQEIFDQSRRIAAAAAARAVGMEVSVSGDGARIVAVVPASPAADVLERGDVVVAVNGTPVRVAADLQQVLRSQPPGTTFTLTVVRDGRRREVEVTTRRLGAPEEIVGIGVLIETENLEVDLPFEIEFEERDIGGPSAGLAYALAIADMLDDTDYARGRQVAATGTMSLTGEVGPVGGVSAKAEATLAAGADLFLVPATEVQAARPAEIPVRGVSTLSEALATLRG